MIKDMGSGKTNRPGQNTFDIKTLEAKTNTELLEAIDEMLARPVEEVDADFVDACLDILQVRVPVAEDFDPQASWERFREEHSALFEIEEEPPVKVAPSKHRRAVPLLRYAGVFVAAMLCLVVTANAFGYNPIQAFMKWVNDTIQIYSNPSGMMELPPDSPSEYHSMREALESCGVDSADQITWIPEDYSISNVRVSLIDGITKVTAIYEAERGELTTRILAMKDTEWNGIEESDLDEIKYEHNEAVYYITSNFGAMKAVWKDEKYSYMISGQVSENEMRKILDSIT